MTATRICLLTLLWPMLSLPLLANELQPLVAPAANGIELPANYKNWKIIGSSHRLDKHSLRIILGNPTAMQAIKSKHTNPWPDGSILAKVVWKATTHAAWPDAIVPGEFEHAEFMIKDQRKYAKTAGWGFARWLGLQQKPYGTAADFDGECVACHAAVKQHDHVFTTPAVLP